MSGETVGSVIIDFRYFRIFNWNSKLLTLLHRIVNQERLQETTTKVADAVFRNILYVELDLLEVGESVSFIVVYLTKKI